jgi:serine---pyruvate transaminase
MIPLFTPGPVTVTDAVTAACARAPVFHRSTEYAEMLEAISAMMGIVLGTEGEVYFLSGSGTYVLESAFQNLCRPGERIVVASNGYFGERLAHMGGRLNLDVTEVRMPWGEPLDAGQVKSALGTDARALFLVHHETSTGYVNNLTPLKELCAEHGTLLVLDAISSAGALPIDMDALGLDVVVATSQKGIGGVPGIGVLAVSPQAWARVESLPVPPTFSADWQRLRAAYHRTPAESLWTPPVTVMAGLHAALVQLAKSPSLQASFLRTERVGAAVRAGLTAADLRLAPAGAASFAPVSVASLPRNISANAVVATLWRDFGVRVGGGQGELADRVIRVSHLGIGLFHVLGLLGALEAVLGGMGLPGSDGRPAVSAATAFAGHCA